MKVDFSDTQLPFDSTGGSFNDWTKPSKEPPPRRAMTDPVEVFRFIMAGNAKMTLESAKTGDHLTYKVRKSDDGKLWFVSYLSGPNNEDDYTYLGIVNDKGQFRLTAKSGAGLKSTVYRAFDYFWQGLEHGVIAKSLHVYHEGRCGRCGRLLTVPESIQRGIGPECWIYVGGKT